MKVATYQGIVEDGQIKFPEATKLPERARVYVVVTETEVVPGLHPRSPRLADPEPAGYFTKEVTEEP